MGWKRNAGAPRLIEWTGERCVPWAPDIQVVYEHFHRYLWASRLVGGKRVLDLASGEGFGGALLSETAAQVVGVDIDAPAVEHARLNYSADNLSYAQADARDLSRFADDSFDVVVAFELIEHLTEQEQVLAGIRRVLAPDGILVISTPERQAYGAARPDDANPFHERELTRSEFEALLGTHFPHTRLWAQHASEGSVVVSLSEPSNDRSATFLLEPDGDEWRPTTRFPLLYMIAVASSRELADLPGSSTLSDPGLGLIHSREQELADRLNQVITERGEEVDRRGEFIHRLEAETAAERSRSRQALDAARQRIGELGFEAFATRLAYTRRIEEVEADADRLRIAKDVTIDELYHWVHGLQAQLAAVDESISWRAMRRFQGSLIAGLGGRESRTVRSVQAAMRTGWRVLGSASSPDAAARDAVDPAAPEPDAAAPEPEFPPVTFPPCELPEVSIVMPLYAGAELTHAALVSIVERTLAVPYEVVIVDDGDDPATRALLANVHGARIITNAQNLGYLRTVNVGAAAARGRWLVLANNDIEVQHGWLDELLDCGRSAPDIAIVSPRYLAPDGSISEAGGIIWNDGTGHNYGRGRPAGEWRYGARREIDYGSAAALLVRSDVWRELGGFDERFAPMYYEDADLCFSARAHGYRVMYEPLSEVIHKEGSTAGTDESAGYKRYQALNRPKFVEKWARVLEEHHLPVPDSAAEGWGGATARRPGRRVLLIDHRVPEWDREAGALRTLAIINELMAKGHHVTVMPDNGFPTEPYTARFQRMGVEVMYGVDLFMDLAGAVAPHVDMAMLSRPYVASRWLTLIRRYGPQAKVLFDTVDLHWVREAREAALQSGADEAELVTPGVSWTRALELALVDSVDSTLVVTEVERRRLHEFLPDASVEVLPLMNPVRHGTPGPAGRSGVVFVGGFQHTPNVDAARRLITGVMPRIWQSHPEVKVQIVGPDVPESISELASDRVEICGWVPEIEPYLDAARLMVAPISFGAGMKGKVTQALAGGLPVVTTPIGAEGLDATDGEDLMVAVQDAELADRALALLGDDELWARLARAGRAIIERRCSPAVFSGLLDTLLVDHDAPPSTSAAS